MKTKVLSTIMAIVMIVTTLCCVIPVTAAESTAVCKNEITGTEYDLLSLALAEADAGDTILLLKDCSYDKAHNPSYANQFYIPVNQDVTVKSATATPVKLTIKNGAIIVGEDSQKHTVTFENVNIEHDNTGVTGNCQALISPRGNCVATFKNCSFTTNGTRGNTNGYVMASSGGGTVNFENCTFNFTHATDASPIFSVYSNQQHPLNVTMTNCTVNSTSKAMRGFALTTTMKVYLNGTNTFNTDGDILSTNSGTGGTVHINGTVVTGTNAKILGDSVKAATIIAAGNAGFGSFAQPVMSEGATLRVNGQSYGMRFTSTVAAAPEGYTASYGTIIAKKATFDGELTSTDWYNATNMIGHEQMLTIRASEGKSTDADGVTTINAAMVKIKEANYGETFAARAYAQYTGTASGNKIIVYSALDTAKHSDTFKGVINDAFAANVKNASETGYTNAVENGTKYTCYTVDQYAELKAIAQ